MPWKFRTFYIRRQKTKDTCSEGKDIKDNFLPSSKCSMDRIQWSCVNLITVFFCLFVCVFLPSLSKRDQMEI